ncbi:uncharacterized protein LOC101858517 isoform X2 [Aplysia californica]|nr:uncharacterized protein LOC101858517 isoform X2 [Aplysia californica]
MSSFIVSLYVISAVLLTSLDVTSGTSDPVADACSPLCNEETSLEVQCARARGCYAPEIKNNTDLFSSCWEHCWHLAGKCFSLCADNFDLILHECFDNCSSHPGLKCISSCFSRKFMDLKAQNINFTGDPGDEFNTTDPYPAVAQNDNNRTAAGRVGIGITGSPPSSRVQANSSLSGVVLQPGQEFVAEVIEDLQETPASSLTTAAFPDSTPPADPLDDLENVFALKKGQKPIFDPDDSAVNSTMADTPEVLDASSEALPVIDSSTGSLDFEDVRKLFLQHHGDLHQSMDSSWHTNAWERVLAMYRSSTDKKMDGSGNGDIGSQVKNHHTTSQLSSILRREK